MDTTTSYKLTAKQEAYANYLFEGMQQVPAYEKAGYAVTKSQPSTLDENACHLANSPEIRARIAELRAAAAAPGIATVAERQMRLTQFIRADLVDFQDSDGEPILSRDVPNHAAAAEYTTQTRYDKDGERIVTKRIKLRDPITAIAELNKMNGDYAPERHVIASKVVFEVVYRGAPEAALSPLATPDGPVIEAGSTPRICELEGSVNDAIKDSDTSQIQ